MKFRVWDPGDQSEENAATFEADGPEEASEKYMESLSTVESLESNSYYLSVRPLEGKARDPVQVKVTVDWEPCFYGEVVQ